MKTTAHDIRELTLEELNLKERELKESYFKLRVQHAMGQVDNPNLLREARRSIAVVKTVVNQKSAQRSKV
ncbi:MAG: 50S ribosomal protein L29 [bacterium]